MSFTTSIVINKTTYGTTKFAPSQALKILTILGKILGGSVGDLAAAGGPKGLIDLKLGDGGAAVIGKAVAGLFQNIDEDKIDIYVKQILANTTYGGGGNLVVNDFETHFQDKLDELFAVLKWVLMVNFGDFFKGLTAKGAALQAVRPVE